MCDKKERILILTGNKEELCKMLDSCPTDAPCTKCDIIIPRSEAVERMAKGIWKADNEDLPVSYWETQMHEAKERYFKKAAAALDALVRFLEWDL